MADDCFTRVDAAFDLTTRVRLVCADMVARLPELSHIDLQRVAISFSRARSRGRFGLYASLTPLRFAGGERTQQRRGRTFTVQRVVDGSGREMLYILRLCVPRFLDLPFHEKLVTILHELWHIGPAFDGDIRRHAGRCFAHTHSQRQYDAEMSKLADRWLATRPDESLVAFLRLNFEALIRSHGRIIGTKLPRPKLVPMD